MPLQSNRPLRVSVVGEAYFARKMQTAFGTDSRVIQFRFFKTNTSRLDQLRFLVAMPTTDLVLAISATVKGGGALRTALWWNKPILQEFIGTDVLTATKALAMGQANEEILRRSTYFCNAPWLHEELKQIGITAPFLPDYLIEFPPEPLPLPDQFSVLTYARDGSEDLYGIPHILHCAENLPDIPFRISGLNVSQHSLPKNVELLGWTDFQSELKRATVLMRLTSHDGLAHTVIEALGTGRWVIRAQRMPETLFAQTGEQALIHLRDLVTQFRAQKLHPNFAGHQYVRQNFSARPSMEALLKLMQQTAGRA